jgi:hypothetical protein
MKIDFRIEELILEGFPAAYRGQIAEVIQRELTQIFTDRGMPPDWSQNRDLGRLDGVSFNFSPGASVETVGAQVASAIAENIDGGSS